MKRIYFNAKVTVIVDDEDYNRVAGLSVSLTGQARGVVSVHLYGRTKPLARIILSYDGPLEVDHKDHNKFNFQKNNLRLATRAQQMANSKPQLDRKYKGVYEHKNGTFRTILKYDGKNISGHYWSTEELAAKEYDKLALKYFGEFARLNFPQKKEAQCL